MPPSENDRIEKHGLKVSPALYSFIDKEALPGSGVDPDKFWSGFAALAVKLMPQNRALLAERDRLQTAIDGWHKANPARPIDADAYTAFLKEIGYLVAGRRGLPDRHHAMSIPRSPPWPARSWWCR